MDDKVYCPDCDREMLVLKLGDIVYICGDCDNPKNSFKADKLIKLVEDIIGE